MPGMLFLWLRVIVVNLSWHNLMKDVQMLVDWDTSKVRDKLKRDIEAHIASVRAAKLSEITSLYEV